MHSVMNSFGISQNIRIVYRMIDAWPTAIEIVRDGAG